VYALLDVPCNQRQVEDQGQPVSVDKEQEGQESVDGDFRDDVRVETVAEVDRVDVVAVQTQLVSIFVSARSSPGSRAIAKQSSGSNWRATLPAASCAAIPPADAVAGGSVPFQIAVHDGEEDLEEEVDRIDDDGEKV
jgi:hypothetical protein